MKEFKCVTCDTQYQGKCTDDQIEVYIPTEDEWSEDCPVCGSIIFEELEGEEIEEEPINQVLTIREASELYDVPYNTLLASDLDPVHCRKSGKTWLIEKEWFENIWIPQWKENQKRWKRR
jgi:hypothetical protein